LFDTIYTEVYGAVDAFAENIRKIKAYTPASLERFSALTAISDEVEVLEPSAMVAELLRDAEKMQEIMKVLFTEAEARGENGLSNFLADRQDAFAKHAWFLRATAKV
jgi:starvation-inducible DNA-binding protein